MLVQRNLIVLYLGARSDRTPNNRNLLIKVRCVQGGIGVCPHNVKKISDFVQKT